jgi:acetylornithine deacetylase/succinyl-diaminopimelate desuccinylase-like protein
MSQTMTGHAITTTEVKSLLSEIIAIDSVNHNFRENRAGEADLCDWVEFMLQKSQIPFERQSVRNRQRNLVARIEGADPTRAICFEAHMDTTTARGMTGHPFGAQEMDGAIHGRGACDGKGALAAMIAALRALRESGAPPPQTVVFAATIDREVGMTGIQRLLLPAAFRPAAAVIGAPTNLGIGRCACGCTRWRFAIGENVQSYAPASRNAITDGVLLVTEIEKRLAAFVASRPHPLLGPPRVRPSRIRASCIEGFLPASCNVDYEAYTVPGCDSGQILDEINDLVSTLVAEDSTLRVSMEAPTLDDGPVETPAAGALARVAAEACRSVLGSADLVGYPDNGHANRFHAAGVPAIVLGPGDPALARACDERVPVEQLAPAAQIYLKLMQTPLA